MSSNSVQERISQSTIAWLSSLGAKLVIAFIGLSLVPLVVVSGFAYWESNQTVREQTVEMLSDNLLRADVAVESWLHERIKDVNQLAADSVMATNNLDEIAAELDALAASGSFYSAIFLTDAEGQTRYMTSGGNVNLADRDYFRPVMQGETVISDLVVSRSTGDLVFVAATPVRDGSEIVGLLGASINMSAIIDILNVIIEGETGEIYLINRDGYFITPSRFVDDLKAEGYIQARAELELKVDSVGSRAVLAGETGSQEYPDYRGITVLGAYTAVEVAGQRWGLLSELDSAEAFADSVQLRNLFLLAVVISGALVVVVALWLSRSISRPLTVLSQVAGKLAGGDIEQQITHQGKDEIGLLAEDFRRMIGYQQQMASAASQLSQGNLNLNVSAQSEHDVLGNAFQQMVAYQKNMADAATQLARGNLAVKVVPKSEQDVLGNAFQQMVSYQREVARAIGQVAKGDLTIEVRPISEQDVLGSSVQKMITHLRQTVGSVQSNAGRLLSASQYLSTASEQANDSTAQIAQTIEMMAETTQQVAQTIGQVAVGAAQQAEVMERSRRVMEDQDRVIADIAQGAMRQSQSIEAADHIFQGRLATAIQQVESATTASDYAVNSAVQAAQSGTQAVAKTITGINTVAKTAEQVTRRISEMGKRSNQIGAIVQVINDIAERTNLLSLNAAIEAARAGEHGKGFAVVADEVRKLADRSAKSAEEISQLVATVQEAANQAVSAMEENDRQVQQGLETAGDAEEALAGIRTSMAEVGAQMRQLQGSVADLAGSSSQVQEAMQQVAGVIEENLSSTSALTAGQEPLQQAMEEIASVAEENSAAAEEVAASAEENSASVEEISAMTKNVNIQVEQMTDAVQSLTAMASDLQTIVAAFQLQSRESVTIPDPYARSKVRSTASTTDGAEQYKSAPAASRPTSQAVDSTNGKRKSTFAWDDSMATGDDTVDEQHRVLIDMINGLIEAMQAGKGRQHLSDILEQLEAYTHDHFSWEEHCMTEHKCPIADVNKTAHERFVQMVAETRQRFETEGPSTELVLAIKDNLGEWFMKHIRRIDSNLRGCVHPENESTRARRETMHN